MGFQITAKQSTGPYVDVTYVYGEGKPHRLVLNVSQARLLSSQLAKAIEDVIRDRPARVDPISLEDANNR
jgi:hypothetical protein